MSDTKFTKGKWSQSHRQGNDGMYNTEVYDSRGQTICILDWHTEPNETRTDRSENAHLIASAPDMYEFIDSLIEFDMLNDADTADAELLLAKARGESCNNK